MQFDPAIHTKDFLMGNPSVAFELAQKSSDFARSSHANDLCILQIKRKDGLSIAHLLAKEQPDWLNSRAVNNKDILNLKTNSGDSVAHSLALYQSAWIYSEAVKELDVLKITNKCGESVAQYLASNQAPWMYSDEAKNKDILKCADQWGWTVAHYFASENPEWVLSESAADIEILKLKNNAGYSVASELLNLESCLKHALIFSKDILTLVENNHNLVAESIVEKYAHSHDLTIPIMALKLISQGAAYKHSKIMTIADGQTILNEAKQLIDDCLEPEVALKHAQALYSTCFHNVERIKLIPSPRGLEKWQNLLQKAEEIIQRILQQDTYLATMQTHIDIFCEPSADLVSRLKSKILLTNITVEEISQAGISDDLTINNGLY
jgi:hypothetical protein